MNCLSCDYYDSHTDSCNADFICHAGEEEVIQFNWEEVEE